MGGGVGVDILAARKTKTVMAAVGSLKTATWEGGVNFGNTFYEGKII